MPAWLIVALAVLVAATGGFFGLAVRNPTVARNRRTGQRVDLIIARVSLRHCVGHRRERCAPSRAQNCRRSTARKPFRANLDGDPEG